VVFMRFILIILIALLTNSTSKAQSGVNKEPINLYNKAGRKTGFWNELVGDLKGEVYYIDRKRNGLEKVYYRSGSLVAFGNYKNGKPIGVSYFFHEVRYLSFTVKYMGTATYRKRKMGKGLFTVYSSSGKIKESGIAFFVEGEEELGEEIRIGEWKKF
jgi:antitoxin component YwqK of YwqJK toxin-antitoxin module